MAEKAAAAKAAGEKALADNEAARQAEAEENAAAEEAASESGESEASTLDFGSTLLTEATETWEEWRERLLNLTRSDPIQLKYSIVPVRKFGKDDNDEPVGWRLNQRNIDLLNDAVPNNSRNFNHVATSVQHDGYKCRHSWIESMNDRNIGGRHAINEVIKNSYCGTTGGRWRLFDELPDYAKPWNTLSWSQLLTEYKEEDTPMGNRKATEKYFKHLQRCYEGEVALSWEEWHPSLGPRREKILWHPQYAKSRAQMLILEGLKTGKRNHCTKYDWLFHEDVDLSAVGDTTILRHVRGSLQTLEGGAITLMELFVTFGNLFTAAELFFWYYQAPKVVKKRAHSTGSAEIQAAAKLRKESFGHYGHRRDAAVGASRWRESPQ